MAATSARLHNTTFAGDLTYDAPGDDLRVFDRLPVELQRRLDRANSKASSRSVEPSWLYAAQRGLPPQHVIARIDQLERNEIAVFAGEYRGLTGCEYPFLAAQGSMQGYGPRGPSRFPPRRYGIVAVPRRSRRRRARV